MPRVISATLIVAMVLGTVAGAPAVTDFAMPANQIGHMINDYADKAGSWAGADGTTSIPLPDGRRVWLFSDTFLGGVGPDGSMSATAKMVNNSGLIQQGEQIVGTLHGGTPQAPASLVPATKSDEFLHVGDGIVEGGKLQVLYSRMHRNGNGTLDLVHTGTELAVFSLPDLTIEQVTTLDLPAGTAWGASLLREDDYIYIYGSELLPNSKDFAKVARVRAGGLAGLGEPWEFWTGERWSGSAAHASRLVSGVGTVFDVQRRGDQFLLVTVDTHVIFNPSVVAYTSSSPLGPFTGPIELLRAPEPKKGGAMIVYAARLHTDLARPGKLLISYDVNSLNPSEISKNARIYRPRFVEADWPRPRPDQSRLPAAPQGLTAQPDRAGRVELAWRPPPAKDVVGYAVYRRDVTLGHTHFVRLPWDFPEAHGDAGDFTEDNHVYEFKVAASNAAGEGPASTVVSAEVQIDPPQRPEGLAATPDKAGNIALTWMPVPGAWSYRVSRRDISAGEQGFIVVDDPLPNDTALTVPLLAHGHRYEFQVVARNGGGESPASAPVQAAAFYDVPPAPTGVAAKSNPDGSIRLSWADAGASLWHWVYIRDLTAGEKQFRQLPLPVTEGNSANLGYLLHRHEYELKVAAANSGGEGPPSATVRATSYYPLPTAPSELTAAAQPDGTIVLKWASTETSAWFRVYQRDVTAGETAFKPWVLPVTTGTQALVTMLTPGHHYEFQVATLTQGGESPLSGIAGATALA